jgi:hypothetical protein
MERNYETMIFWSIFCVLLLLFLMIYLFSKSDDCIYFETCDHLSARIEKHRMATFCLNESNGEFHELRIFNTYKCISITTFDRNYSIKIFSVINDGFQNETICASIDLYQINKPARFRLHQFLF